MLDLDKPTARRILDALALAIDKKPASAKTFQQTPFNEIVDLTWWDDYNLPKDTPRTVALTIAYLLFSGGRIPLQGIEMRDSFFRPDQYIVGAFLKNGRFRHDETTDELIFTDVGWEWLAGVFENMEIA